MPATCPFCHEILTEIGEIGIMDADGRWEAQTTRYSCENDHMVFVTSNGFDLIKDELAFAIDEDEEIRELDAWIASGGR